MRKRMEEILELAQEVSEDPKDMSATIDTIKRLANDALNEDALLEIPEFILRRKAG